MWRPNSSEIKVMLRKPFYEFEQQEKKNLKSRYPYWCGGGCLNMQKASHERAKLLIFIEAIHMIVRDKVDYQAVHSELLKIDEYADGLAGDVPGVIER